MRPETKLPKVGTTIFTVMSQLAAEHGAVNLGQGFPDFPVPARLVDALDAAMRAGHNQYAPMTGVPALRQAIAAKALRCYGATVDPDTEITVTSGATEAIFNAIHAVVRPGEEVIVLDPAYDCYEPAIDLAGAVLAAHHIACQRFRRPGAQRAQHLDLLVAHRGRIELRRWFHRHQAQQLQQVVLQHVAHRAGVVVVVAAAFHAHGLADGDLHLLDVACVPQRFEQRVAEAQRDQVLHAFLGEVVVDAVDPLLVEGHGNAVIYGNRSCYRL